MPHREPTRLLAAWRDCVRSLSESKTGHEQWKEVAEALADDADTPDMWIALFSAVPANPKLFQEAVWPIFHSVDVLTRWHFKKYVDPCVHALAKTAVRATLSHWQDVVLALKSSDLRRQNYRDGADSLEKLISSYLLCLPDPALTEASRQFLARCKPENIGRYHASQPQVLSPVELEMMERQHSGLNPNDPLHRRLERDLDGLTPPGLKKAGPGILKRIAQIEVRFLQVESRIQNRLRAQFQNGFSFALLQLAQKSEKLTGTQLDEMLGLCEGLLEAKAGRDNVLGAIALALANKPKHLSRWRGLLERIVAQPEPEIISRVGFYFWGFLKPWPEFVWGCLDRWTRRIGDGKEVAESFGHALHDDWFWRLFRTDSHRAFKLLQDMLDSARRAKQTDLADGFLAWFAAVAIHENHAPSREIVESALSRPELNGTEFAGVVGVLVDYEVPREPTNTAPVDHIKRASALAHVFFYSAGAALEQWHQDQLAVPKDQKPKAAPGWIPCVIQQFDRFASELRFSAEQHVKALNHKAPGECQQVAEAWWERSEPLFGQLQRWLHPHLGDALIDALAAWFSYCPSRSLHWLRRLCEAGSKTGLLFERLVVSAVIKILQRCLAEHRDLLVRDKAFFDDFAAVLEALLSTADVEALGMAASLDEFYR